MQIVADMLLIGKARGKRTTLKKREVLDVVFEIYKPEGTGIVNDRKSTWLHPIVDGEDALKLVGECVKCSCVHPSFYFVRFITDICNKH